MERLTLNGSDGETQQEEASVAYVSAGLLFQNVSGGVQKATRDLSEQSLGFQIKYAGLFDCLYWFV